MQTFPIVKQTGVGKRRVNGRMVDTMQAVVRFPDGDTTRHLIRQPNGSWTGRNSDRVLAQRAGILRSHEQHEGWVRETAEHIEKLNASMADLKGKRGNGMTAKRNQLKEALKHAKAALATAQSDLAKVKAIADKVDETHPDIVAFE